MTVIFYTVYVLALATWLLAVVRTILRKEPRDEGSLVFLFLASVFMPVTVVYAVVFWARKWKRYSDAQNS